MEIAEIAELEDVHDDLAALSVAEVVIQPIVDATMDPPTGWQAVVILSTPDHASSPHGCSGCDLRTFRLERGGDVPSAGSSTSRAATASAPAVEGWNNVVTTQRALRAVDAWKQRRGDRAAPADPAPADATATALTPPEVFPLSAPAPCYRETAYEQWRLEVRPRREQQRLTQVQLAGEVGMSPSNLSRIERGLKKPSVELANGSRMRWGCEHRLLACSSMPGGTGLPQPRVIESPMCRMSLKRFQPCPPLVAKARALRGGVHRSSARCSCGGEWKDSRATDCSLTAMVGMTCPPPDPGRPPR